MKGLWGVTLLLSLSAAALSGCYVLPAHPAYTYPVYVPAGPAYAPPSPPASGAPLPGGSQATPPPSGGSPSQGSARNCQTVTVEGHSETRVRPDGQRETVWVPTHTRQICQ